MEEIDTIFKRALELLKVSESNFSNEFYPDSINRSYYAAFYAVKALLLKKGITTKTHSGTIRQFNFEYVHKGTFDIEISKFFSKLEEDRRNADYDISYKITKNKAMKDLKNAKCFI
jgi:uncharacterized protein (UPF0332 family)